jgi:sugar phosphate isomerase/epimerase
MAHPLSVQLYAVRDFMADRDDVLRRLADIGFRSVEPYDPANDPTGFRKTADSLGISVSSVHAIDLVRGDDPAAVFDAIAVLGTDKAIVPAGIAEAEFTTVEGIARAAEVLNGLAAQAASHGLSLGYHNHWWEFEPTFEGRHALELLADQVDPAVFFEVDTYWSTAGGADTPAVLGRLGDRVRLIHVKDGPGVIGRPHTAAGQGSIDIPAILAAAPQAVRVIELDNCDTDMFQALADSYAYVTGLEPELLAAGTEEGA